MSIMHGRQGVVSAASTYNLKLDTLSVEFNCPDLEVDADSGDEGGCPCVVAEPQKQARLSNTYFQVGGSTLRVF